MGFECDFVFLSGQGGIAVSSLQLLLWLGGGVGVPVLLQNVREDLALFEGQHVIILYQRRVGRETPLCGVCGGGPWAVLEVAGILRDCWLSLPDCRSQLCFPDHRNTRFLPSAAHGKVLKKVQIKSCQECQKFNKLVVCRYRHI